MKHLKNYKNKTVALIPARSRSKRIKNKNIINFYGHPLLAYSISEAIKSNLFSRVICVTDSSKYAKIAEHYGAEVPAIRPKNISSDTSPDIEWIKWILKKINKNKKYQIFSILRPTNPFRTHLTIRRAFDVFLNKNNFDSLRAVEICKQHPGKMWSYNGEHIVPLFPLQDIKNPFHSSQMASLPKVYIQNASLEIAWTKTVYENNTIAGNKIKPFFTKDYEGVDINEYEDLLLIDKLIEKQKIKVNKINTDSWF